MDKRLLKTKKLAFGLMFLLISLNFLVAMPVKSAGVVLSISPLGGTYEVGDTFSSNIYVALNGAKADTIRVNLNYSNDLLEVLGVSLGSVYTVQAGGNYFDNNKGTMSFGAGVPKGTTADAVFATIKMKAKKVGVGDVIFLATSKVISNGTSLSSSFMNASYTIKEATVKEDVKTTTPVVKTTTPTTKSTVEKESTPTPTSAEAEKEVVEATPIINSISMSYQTGKEMPIFKGKVNVAKSKVSFEVLETTIKTEVVSDENGEWQWQIPGSLKDGQYSISITATDPINADNFVTENRTFTIKGAEMPGIVLNAGLIVKNTNKTLNSSDKLSLSLLVTNYGKDVKNDTVIKSKVTYYIQDVNKKKLVEESESVEIKGKETTLVKTIGLPKNIKAGSYLVKAEITYGEKDKVSSSDSFTVKSVSGAEKSNLKSIIGLIVGIVVLFIVLIAVAKGKGKK